MTVFLVQRLGPYHHARLRAWAAARTGRVNVIEFRSGEAVYAWAPVVEDGGYGRFQSHSNPELSQRLAGLQPQVIVCVGYADPEVLHAVTWALRRCVPLVLCSDSTWADEPRNWIKEMLKRQVVRCFDSALVAGTRASDYLTSLGLPAQRQFRPWDVVDNSYFENGADLGRANEMAARLNSNLPSRYFLCVARFVPKKNIHRLIEAYLSYANRSCNTAWSLVLSGSGPLEAEFRDRVASANLSRQVRFLGFQQYPALPTLYGLAGALVLPSESDQWGLVVNEAMAAGLPVLVSARCGCAVDLVSGRGNGFTFEPDDVTGLADLMSKVAGMDQPRRAAIGRRSREIIAAYSPVAFAEGLEAAVTSACSWRVKPRSLLLRMMVSLLAKRSPRAL